MQKLMVDLSGPEPVERMVDLSPDEVAEHEARSKAHAEESKQQQARADLLASLHPDEKLTAKLVDGTPLTEAERTQLERWHALRALSNG